MKIKHKKYRAVVSCTTAEEAAKMERLPGWVSIGGRRFASEGMSKKQCMDQLAEAGMLDGPLDGMKYIPAAARGNAMNVIAPDSLHIHQAVALRRIEEKIGMDIADYVMEKCAWTEPEMESYLYAEQIDSVGQAIYQIERKQAMIIADMAGIGKGRQGAAIVRFAVENGYFPVLMTEKAGLFSDFYRDLADTGQKDVRIAIINNSDDANIIYNNAVAFKQKDSKAAIELKDYSQFDMAMCTYSQFGLESNKRVGFVYQAPKLVLILDESHNASGISSKIGIAIRKMLSYSSCAGAVFLSATFAKNTDSLSLYYEKTPLKGLVESFKRMEGVGYAPKAGSEESGFEKMAEAFDKIGDPAMESVSSMLAKSGNLVRREREFKQEYMEYLYLPDDAEMIKVFDSVTQVLQNCMISVQETVMPNIDDFAKSAGADIRRAYGAGFKANAQPAFTRLFTVMRHLLACVKAESLADAAIKSVKDGFNAIVAYDATGESGIAHDSGSGEEEEEAGGEELEILEGQDGQKIDGSYFQKLSQVVAGVRRFTVRVEGEKKSRGITISHSELYGLCPFYREAYNAADQLERSGLLKRLPSSPIDAVRRKLDNAKIKFGEITGRAKMLDYSACKNGDYTRASLVRRNEETDTTKLYNAFNENELNLLIVNRKGATGKSAHAVPTRNGSPVRPRKMIVGENELNINVQIQKFGRIFRTGQVLEPSYLMVCSFIPCENRLFSMMERKLAMLSAATTGNKSSDFSGRSMPDILNAYGQDVLDALIFSEWKKYEGTDTQEGRIMLALSLALESKKSDKDKDKNEDLYKISRVLIATGLMSTADQRFFYSELFARYQSHIEELRAKGADNSTMQVLELNAVPKGEPKELMPANYGIDMPFGEGVKSCEYEIDNLYKAKEWDEAKELLGSRQPLEEYYRAIDRFKSREQEKIGRQLTESRSRYKAEIEECEANEDMDGRDRAVLKFAATKKALENDQQALDTRIGKLTHLKPGSYISYMDPGMKGQEGALSEFGYILSATVPEKLEDAIPSKCYLTVVLNGMSGLFKIPFSKNDEINGMYDFNVWCAKSGKYPEAYNADNETIFKKVWADEASLAPRVRLEIITGNILRFLIENRKLLSEESGYKHYIAASFTMSDGTVMAGFMPKPGRKKSKPVAAKSSVHPVSIQEALDVINQRVEKTDKKNLLVELSYYTRFAERYHNSDIPKLYLYKSADMSYMYSIGGHLLLMASAGSKTVKDAGFALKYGSHSSKAKVRGYSMVYFVYKEEIADICGSSSRSAQLAQFVADYMAAAGIKGGPQLYLDAKVALEYGIAEKDSGESAAWHSQESKYISIMRDDEEYMEKKAAKQETKKQQPSKKESKPKEKEDEEDPFIDAVMQVIAEDETAELLCMFMDYIEQGVSDKEAAERVFYWQMERMGS